MPIHRRKPVDRKVEVKILINLITSDDFCKAIIPALQPDLFRMPNARTIAWWCREYYENHDKAPGKYIQKIYEEKAEDKDEITRERLSELLSSISDDYEADPEEINVSYEVDQALGYFKKRHLEETKDELNSLIVNSNIEEAEELLHSAINKIPSIDLQKIEKFTGEEMFDMEIPSAIWIIQGVIPVGVSLLAGKPKVGKSLFILNSATAVCSGKRKVFGRKLARAGKVLYLGLEDNKQRMQKRLKTLTTREELQGNLDIYFEYKKMNQGGLQDIENWIEENKKNKRNPRLVVIDTLERVRTRPKKEGYFYSDDYNAILGLQKLAGKHKIAIVVVHHVNKSDANDVFDKISGTTGLYGAADTALILSKKYNSAVDYTLSLKGRDFEDQEFALQFEKGIWTILGDAEDFQKSEERQMIVKLLETENRLMTTKEIKDHLKDKIKSIDMLLSILTKDGSIIRTGRGTYTHSNYGLRTGKKPLNSI